MNGKMIMDIKSGTSQQMSENNNVSGKYGAWMIKQVPTKYLGIVLEVDHRIIKWGSN